MVYNPDKTEIKSALPEDVIFEAAITNIQDGTVKDFVTNLDKWKDPDQPAIKLDMETSHDGQQYKFSEVFTYRNEGDKVVFGKKSKLGKFAEKYGSAPKAGMKVKALTNSEGYLRLKIE